MSAWDDHFAVERARIEKLLRDEGLYGIPLGVPIAPPPTRAETIKYCWEHSARRLWPTLATESGLIVEHDLGIIAPIHFEQRRYGDVMVVEAEGVIVERVVIHG